MCFIGIFGLQGVRTEFGDDAYDFMRLGGHHPDMAAAIAAAHTLSPSLSLPEQAHLLDVIKASSPSARLGAKAAFARIFHYETFDVAEEIIMSGLSSNI